MLRLRILLFSKWPYFIILALALITTFFRLQFPPSSKYQGKENKITGIITEKTIQDDRLFLTVLGKEPIQVYYYFQTTTECRQFDETFYLGDQIKVEGTLERLKRQSIPLLFSYQQKQNQQGIFYQMELEHYQKLDHEPSLFFRLKNFIYQRVQDRKTKPYILAFLLGDKSMLNEEVKTSYQENGISHLLAISGMHVSFLSGLLLKILKKCHVKETGRYLITAFLLFCYLFLSGGSSSMIRAVLFFLFFSLNKIFYLHIKPIYLWCLTLSIVLFYRPTDLVDAGCQFSFIISFFLLYFASWINRGKNYGTRLFRVSLLAFLASSPITIYHYSQINLLSVLYNLFYVPLVTFFLYPVALLTFFVPFLDRLYYLGILLLEQSSLYLNQHAFLKLIFCKPAPWMTVLSVLLWFFFFWALERKKVLPLFLPFLMMTVHYYEPMFFGPDEMMLLDVGQGDSILLRSKNQAILIDTGGKLTYQNRSSTSSIVKTKTIPYLKALGIRSLDYLILSHGDYDHMGESIDLVNHFKVEHVIFNNDSYNSLELELISVLKNKHIAYYQNVQKIRMAKINLYFLNTGIYDNENDNSNVIYTEWNGVKMLLMGDAGIEVEKNLLTNYNLPLIDILKVGHHGSNSSTSQELIDVIKPKYSLISVGKDNKFGHPRKEVLEVLKHQKILRTDQDGSILFQFKKNGYTVKTYAP